MSSFLDNCTQRQKRWSKRVEVTWVNQTVRTNIVHVLSSYRYKTSICLTSWNRWNFSAKFNLCLASTVQILKSIWSTRLCYPIVWTREIKKPLLSKKQTNSSRSNLLKLSWWIRWIFLVEQQVLIPSCRHTKPQKLNDSSSTNDLITLTKGEIQNFSIWCF